MDLAMVPGIDPVCPQEGKGSILKSYGPGRKEKKNPREPSDKPSGAT